MKKRVLIAGGSHSDIPLINAAKTLGFHVITSGNNPNDLGHTYADETYLEDFSDQEAMLRLAKRLHIDYIVPSANDFSMITCSYIAEKMHLPGYDDYETTLMLHHKDQFKHFMMQHNFHVPKSKIFTSLSDALTSIDTLQYPAIVKPVDLTGGKGVSKITTEKEADQAIKSAFGCSRIGKIVIDDFIDGTLHSFSTIIVNQKIRFWFADNEHSYLNPYLVSTSSSPAINIENIQEVLIEQTEKLATLLNLTDGILHMQYIKDNKDNIYIIEYTRRMPGDLYYLPVQQATAIDYVPYILKAYCGIDISDITFYPQKGYHARHCIMSSKNGQVDQVNIDPILHKNIKDQLLWYSHHDTISNYMTYKAGILFLSFSTQSEMEYKLRLINDFVQIKVRD